MARIRARAALWAGIAWTLLNPHEARAQGVFVNFETHPVHGLTTADLGELTVVLVCNPPDNSVAVIDAANGALLERVRVGLGPVSVLFDPTRSCFYTANRIGDSVTRVEISAPGGALSTRVLRTENVGDEPADLAFNPDDTILFVTLMSQSRVTLRDPDSLAALLNITVTDPLFAPDAERAMKHPARMVRIGTRLHTLSRSGDTGFRPGSSGGFQFDMQTYDFVAPAPRDFSTNGLGSTHFDAVAGADGRLYITGSQARNDVIGPNTLSTQPSGFVESHLYVLPAGFAAGATPQDRDLNQTAGGQVVASAQSVSQPTGIALYQPTGVVERAYIASFNNDTIVCLEDVGNNDVTTWQRSTFPVASPSPDRLAGPRSLEIVGDRLFVLCSLDLTVRCFDLAQDPPVEISSVTMNDPFTVAVHEGRRYLYDSRISGTGKVSCASCHVDGKTDGQLWLLSEPDPDPNNNVAPIPPERIDGITDSTLTVPPTFPDDKDDMVTQTLQGLVNHPVNADAQFLLSNAPYHWRGDRSSFTDFNEAFVSLMGAPALDPTLPPLEQQGISGADMRTFRDAVFTIMYPPNPEQPLDRVYSGDFGDPDEEDGSGALRGLKLFHTLRLPRGVNGVVGNMFSGRSCVHCHMLPEGSNNRLTLVDDLSGSSQPLETAAMRGLLSREGRLETGPTASAPIGALPRRARTRESGLNHAGALAAISPEDPRPQSINGFITEFFSNFFTSVEQLEAVIEFSRQFDAGVAPMIGQVITVDQANANDPSVTARIIDMEVQAQLANAGLAVVERAGETVRGYFYDVTRLGPIVGGQPPAYREEGTSTFVDRATLLATAQSDEGVVIFQATPLGSERRYASSSGVGAVLTGASIPSNVTLETLRPATQWRVPTMTRNWIAAPSGDDFFVWDPPNGEPEPISQLAIRVYQAALTGIFGVDGLRHEMPRRWRVSGGGIRPGAFLEVTMSTEPSGPPPGTVNPAQLLVLRVPIFPSHEYTPTNQRIWESTAELEPVGQMIYLCGGIAAPDVLNVFNGLVPEGVPNALDPNGWNWVFVRCINEDGTVTPLSSGSWQRVRVE